ncbi:MAG: amino acid racemase, partial [bacterium]
MGRKVIGILGGMGPEATADLFLKIIRATPAEKDQDHLRVIIDNNPQIPDRTAAIFSQGDDPLPLLVETAKNLARAGADFIVIPCNTAHY